MGRLIYSAIASLDGYVNDDQGAFDWAAPDEELHAFVNEQERPVGTYLYGRRMYATMVAWETMPTGPEQPAVSRDYAAIWRAADKVVYSTTLAGASSARTRIEPVFDPAAVAALVRAADRDVSVGGPGLAAAALGAGLVDEVRVFVVPEVVGGGTRFLPAQLRLGLRLRDTRRFAGGAVLLSYEVRRD